MRAWIEPSRNVPNGGFDQFFCNNRGDDGLEEFALLLDSLDMPKASPRQRSKPA
jgi:hypothetical protein